MGVAQLHEARALVGRVGIDGAAQVQRVVGHQAHGPAFDARQRGVDSSAKTRAQRQQTAFVHQALHGRARIVGAQAVFGHHAAQQALVGRDPVAGVALEEAEVLARRMHGFLLVRHQHVDHAIGVLHGAGAHILGREHAQPAAFDHGRAAHAQVAVLRRDDHVAAPHQRRVAGKAAPGDDADHRHLTRQCRIGRESAHVQTGQHVRIDIARAPASAFGEQHHGQFFLQRQVQDAVRLGVVAHALRAGQHGGVVRHHGGAGALGAEERAIDAAHACHHAVGRGVGDQVFHAAAARLRGNRQRAVFDEAAFVAQIGNVLARGALVACVAFGHRVRPRGVERACVAVDHALQIGANVVGVVRGLLGGGDVGGVIGFFQHQDRVAGCHVRADFDQHGAHHAGVRRIQGVLHLHGFQHGEFGAGRHAVTNLHRQRHQPRRHGRQHSAGRCVGHRCDARIFSMTSAVSACL